MCVYTSGHRDITYVVAGFSIGWVVCVSLEGWGRERPITWIIIKTISMAGKMSSNSDLQ